jgi:hypothetical protein
MILVLLKFSCPPLFECNQLEFRQVNTFKFDGISASLIGKGE